MPAFYSAYVDVINGILRLTSKEREVFSLMLGACKELGTNGIITQGVRDIIRTTTNMSPPNLSKVTRTLKNKSVVIKLPNGDWQINKSLMPTIEKGICSITYQIILNG